MPAAACFLLMPARMKIVGQWHGAGKPQFARVFEGMHRWVSRLRNKKGTMILNTTAPLENSVENCELDSHHRLIFELIKKVEVAITDDREIEFVSTVLMELQDYASYHFGAEEALFEIHAYPEAQAHAEHHLEFRAHLSELLALTERGEKAVRLELLRFLREWLRDHIMLRDWDYIPYLRDETPRKAG